MTKKPPPEFFGEGILFIDTAHPVGTPYPSAAAIRIFAAKLTFYSHAANKNVFLSLDTKSL